MYFWIIFLTEYIYTYIRLKIRWNKRTINPKGFRERRTICGLCSCAKGARSGPTWPMIFGDEGRDIGGEVGTNRPAAAPVARSPRPSVIPFSPPVGCDLSSVGLCAGDGWHHAKIRPRSPRSGSVYTNGPAKTSPSTVLVGAGLVWSGLAWLSLAWHVPFIVCLENTPSAVAFPAATTSKGFRTREGAVEIFYRKPYV